MQTTKTRAWSWTLCALLAASSGGVALANFEGQNQANQQFAITSKDGSWTSLPAGMPEIVKHGQPAIRPKTFTAWMLDRDAVNKTLAIAPTESMVTRKVALPAELQIPMPDGTLERFAISEVSVMEPGLAAKMPTFKAYAGRSIDDPTKTIRCEMSELGFTGQIFSLEGVFLIEPYNQFDQQFYVSFRKDVLEAPKFHCGVDGQTLDNNPVNADGTPKLRLRSTARTVDNRKTYRLAIATTPQFTSTNGGDAATLARIGVMANRLNQIYTQEFNIGLTLIANNNTIIYNSTTNIPGSAYNQASASAMLTTNQTNLTAKIGAANYDVGHVVGAVAVGSENGIAGAIGNVCTTTKAQGVSLGSNTPLDEFVVDYVAHEMGHQFGGRHLFNSCGGSQGDSSTLAVEPGSGITIMGYAGICGSPDDIAAHSIAYFNIINIDQIVAYTTSGTGTCFTSSVTGNTAPVPNAGLDYTIPVSTPYVLTGSATDANGDTLTYSWEQADGGAIRGLGTTSGAALAAGPLVIPRVPTAGPSRMFPPLANLLANTLNAQDLLPSVARTMNFRMTARDNNGGVDADAMVLTVSGSTPFAVTSPNTAVNVNAGIQTVTWTVAGTNAAPFNSPNVKISLSTDGGNTFPTVLAASTPNTGSANVNIPNINTNQARIKIESIGNIFFDISNTNFTIVPPLTSPNFNLGVRNLSDAVANGNNNGVIDPGETNIAVTVTVGNNGVPSTNTLGTLSSLTATASIKPASATQAYPDIPSGGSGSNAVPYILQVDPSHPCGNPINLRLTMNADGLAPAQTFDFSLPTGANSGSGVPVTFTYSGAAVAIPDNNATGANATVVVSGLTGTISKVQFKFTGTACSNTAGSTTVGLSHTWVGDLIGTLKAPDNTSVVMFSRPGATVTLTTGSSGNNFCQTLFDDAAANSIQTIASGGTGDPYTGSWIPANPLAGFNGKNPNGTWTLNVADRAGSDTGFIRSFDLIITTFLPPTCTPPIVVNPACNPADICGSGATYDNGAVDIGPDSQLSIDDFLVFLAAFSDSTGCPGSAPCNPADICGSGATYDNGVVDIGPDGELTIDDFLVFLAAFSDATGCP